MIRAHSCHRCSLDQITLLAKGTSEHSMWMRERKQTGAIDFSPFGSTSLGFWLTHAVFLLWARWLLPNWLALTSSSLINIHFFFPITGHPWYFVSGTAWYASPRLPWLFYFVSSCGTSTCQFHHFIIEDEEQNISTIVTYKSPVVHLLKSMKAEINWHQWKMQ